jgi:hypothetical protein
MRTNAGFIFRMASSARGCKFAEGSNDWAAPNCCVTSRDEQQTASRQAEVLKQRPVSISQAFAREQGARKPQIGAPASQRRVKRLTIEPGPPIFSAYASMKRFEQWFRSRELTP